MIMGFLIYIKLKNFIFENNDNRFFINIELKIFFSSLTSMYKLVSYNRSQIFLHIFSNLA